MMLRCPPVLGKPNSFLFLYELSLSGTQLSDMDMIHVHHLPRLARLWLGSTGIGNEAYVFLLSILLVGLSRLLHQGLPTYSPQALFDRSGPGRQRAHQ